MARARVSSYFHLVKFSHSVFALPFALAAVALAVRAGAALSLGRVALIVIAVVAARTAAMGFNRLVDLRFDKENPRTRSRELVTGALGRGQAIALVAGASLLFLAAAWALSPLCVLAAPFVLAILLGYSFTKRFTWACHAVLGLALGLAPVGAWVAMRGTLEAPALALALAVLTWVAGFDVLYALADLEFDQRMHLHSIPARFGIPGALALSAGLHLVTIAALGTLGAVAGLGWIYWSGLGIIFALLVYEHALVRPADLSRLDMAFFTLNGYVSLGFLLFTVVDVALLG